MPSGSRRLLGRSGHRWRGRHRVGVRLLPRDRPREHAEEVALAQLPQGDPRLAGATIYSTLEPCSQRSASRTPCAYRILEAGIPRVVIAWREPSLFVDDCVGYEQLVEAGVTVVELPELAAAAKATNSHLPGLGEEGSR
ncbi:dCMP deaminase [Streptomyces drozdowiczii]|uniref:dCMP deaminase n=1 Tax=Streptomyces drozdowiczii TaxID=202862 RepID=A0ABY6Q1J6_9ACTN|nr:dCMP deaminase [Streptomyces drozdowiczii]UZK58323.1 dCMP deaminase [Streptomyces drozdowiczii]